MHAWLASSLRRFYPNSPAETQSTHTLHAARGERVSFQVVVRTDDQEMPIQTQVDAPASIQSRLRRVGYVPARHLNTKTPLDEIEGVGHIPGLVPDPLLPETQVHAGPHETNAFWVSLTASPGTAPGEHPITVTLTSPSGSVALTATLVVYALQLPQRRNFPITHWLYADALCDWYKVEPWSDQFWTILSPYLTNLVNHGSDTLYVPMFTPPLDGVKRPTQLLGVKREGDTYHFDWSLVKHWINLAQMHGFTRFEWTHLFTQWGAQNAIRIYEGRAETRTLLWPTETGATSDTYRNFLSQLLPELHRFVSEEDLLARSFFHLSDEPHGPAHLANYRAARDLLRELAPWMRVMDALSEIEFAREGLTDIPIPSISTAPQFAQEGFPAWAYFCCGPRGRHLNRLLDTPLTKIRMSGWLLYRLDAKGFLHWGYNYWYRRQTTELIDPYTVNDAHAWPGWASGDPFVVYPGPDGPIDSLRWEIFAESLQDYALLQAARIAPDDTRLADIHDYADFPRDADWITTRREGLLTFLDALN